MGRGKRRHRKGKLQYSEITKEKQRYRNGRKRREKERKTAPLENHKGKEK